MLAEMQICFQKEKMDCFMPIMLANAVDMLFSSSELALKLSNSSRNTALQRHNERYLEKTPINIYTDIITKQKGAKQ